MRGAHVEADGGLRCSLAAAIGWVLPAREAEAQVLAGTPYMSSYRVSDYFVAPGWYGTSYGFASYGFPQTYSVYSAFPPRPTRRIIRPMACCRAAMASGSGGPAMWRRDMCTGRPYYPSSGMGYRTFPVMYGTAGRAMDPAPPFGYYAPALGPGPDPRPAPYHGY